ncbi:MAG: hypothetical protein LBH28_06065 [Oscillospiraceae bacterium]|jgi:hypothetical protein|nr:hypothetical protein [Oscillospiraceae bacterium]
MKKIAFILIVLLLAGCSPSKRVDTEINSPNTTPSKPVGTDTSSPDTVPSGNGDASSDNDAKNEYYKLKTEFENEIHLATQETRSGYPFEILQTFEEMLQYRQSLEDVNEEMGHFYSEQYDDFQMSIDVKAVFSDGKTNYRILLFSAWYLPLDRMFIQIYDEEYFESRRFGDYIHEGGQGKEILYCCYIQEPNKNYLVIINKDYNYAGDSVSYDLVNYEIDGKEISNYVALEQEISKGMWNIDRVYSDYYEVISAEISYSDSEFWLGYLLNLGYGSQETFVDNTFTIVLNNESKDEISLLFKDGFWEVIETYATSALTPDGQLISTDSHDEYDFGRIYEPILAGWKSAYKKAMNGGNPYSEEYSFRFYSGENPDSTKAYYAFYDIDGNGIPELILRKQCDYEDIIAYIFSIQDGKAVDIFGYDLSHPEISPREVPWSRAGSSDILSNGLIDCTSGDYSIYRIADDGCSVAKIASSEPYDYPDMAHLAEAKWRYYTNGTLVDYDVYAQYLKTQGYSTSGDNTLAIIYWDIMQTEDQYFKIKGLE